jgi:hypothetical protein
MSHDHKITSLFNEEVARPPPQQEEVNNNNLLQESFSTSSSLVTGGIQHAYAHFVKLSDRQLMDIFNDPVLIG